MKIRNTFFVAAGMMASAVYAQKQEQPNIILMLADDLGYNDLTCYRNAHNRTSPLPPTAQTPNLDKLAGEGIRFTDFYCGAAVSSPSRASLITGRNCTREGIYNYLPAGSPMHLRSSEITIAEMLKGIGYQTGHFGKWHLTSIDSLQPMPNAQGYDYSFWVHNNAEPSHKDPVNFFRNDKAIGALKGYSCDLVTDEAMKWISSAKKDKPFYIDVWFNESHDKCAAPEELTSRHQYNKEYYGCIENMDRAIGRLMQFLKENGLEKNTIVIFSSDNGSQVMYSNYPLIGKKHYNFEGGVRVPFIIRWTGKYPAAKVCSANGSFTDILPTFAQVTGAKLPADRVIDGISLASVFNDPDKPFTREKPVFFYRYFHDPICMLREGDWCLLGFDRWYAYYDSIDAKKTAKFQPKPGDTWGQWAFQPGHMNVIPTQEPKIFELYNLREDREQQHNVADKHPDIVARMKEKMLKLRKEMVTEGGDWYSK